MNRVGRLQKEGAGFTVFEVMLAVLVLVGLALATHFITHHHHQANKSSTPAGSQSSTPAESTNSSTGSYAILSPATVPSKIQECSQTLTFTTNGNVTPISCDNGDLNVPAWQALAALEPKVMTLGYDATPAQVQAALCADTSANVSNVDEESSYQISSLYYGWHFSTNPSIVLTDGTCVNVDD